MASEQGATLAFVFSLVGGILIALGSVLMLVMNVFFSALEAFGTGALTGGGLMLWITCASLPREDVLLLFSLGIVFGGITILGALLLESRPLQRFRWGAVILVFSIMSLAGTGLFLIGAVLGIAGGIIAMTGLWWPRAETGAPAYPH